MKRCLPVFLLIALVVSVPNSSYSQVRTAPASGSNADLRPAYATPQDIAEGKRVAEASCASCHGLNGISTTKGVPHIAGQRPGYLYVELLVYQSGARGDNAMSNAVKFMKDDALVKVAAYYASLEPAQPTRNRLSPNAAPAQARSG